MLKLVDDLKEMAAERDSANAKVKRLQSNVLVLLQDQHQDLVSNVHTSQTQQDDLNSAHPKMHRLETYLSNQSLEPASDSAALSANNILASRGDECTDFQIVSNTEGIFSVVDGGSENDKSGANISGFKTEHEEEPTGGGGRGGRRQQSASRGQGQSCC